MQVNWLTFFIGLLALFAGYKLNQYANKQSEDRIIAAFIKEIESIKNKQKTSRITQNEERYMQDLEAQLYLLKNWDTY